MLKYTEYETHKINTRWQAVSGLSTKVLDGFPLNFVLKVNTKIC